MDLSDYKYNIETICSEAELSEVIKEWWGGVDIPEKTIHKDKFPKEFHGRYTAKDSDNTPAAVHVWLSMKKGDEKNTLKILVQLNAYTRDDQGLFRGVVCGIYKVLREKDPRAELKKGYLIQRRIEC
jgi:hypothetical protein